MIDPLDEAARLYDDSISATNQPPLRPLKSLYDTFENLGKQIFGTDGTPIEREKYYKRAVTRNLRSPLTQETLRASGLGTPEEQLARYSAFDAEYRRAVAEELQQEIDGGLRLPKATRLKLQRALDPEADINLQLISNLTVRRELKAQLQTNVLQLEALVKGARSTWNLSSF